MADNPNSVSGTFGGNVTTDALTLINAGLVAVDLQRTAGTLTVTLQTSLDGGANFAPAIDANGTALAADMSASVQHKRFEIIGQGGQQFQLVSTSDSSGAVPYKMSRVVVPV